MEHLTVLQRHLEESLKDQSTDGGATNVSRGDTHYTSYYFGGVDEEGETSSGPDQPASSTPKKPSPRRLSSDLTATKAALRDATEQVGWLGLFLECLYGTWLEFPLKIFALSRIV